MVDVNEEVIRSLAAVRSEQGVTTCYLDVDGSRHVNDADYQRVYDSMAHRLRAEPSVNGTSADLDRISAVVHEGFDRSRVRGVAIFSSVDAGLWEVIELPVRVRSQLVVNDAPVVAQLEAVCQQKATIGVLLADKTHARVFVFRLDELVEHKERTDDLGRDYDTVGEHDRGGVEAHREELQHQHLRHAAELLWSAFQAHEFDHLVLAVPDHLSGELTGDLHPYLRERLRGSLGVEPSASTSEIRDAVVEVAARIEENRERRLVADLRAAVGAGQRAVVGLAPVLDALAEQRVSRMLVSDGFEAPGWECPACGRLATVGRECRCGAEMDHVDDVVAHGMDELLAHHGTVEVCTNADLDVLGRIGAFLHY